LIFVCFVGPGPVIGLVPCWLSGWQLHTPIAWWRYLGIVMVLAGAYPLADSMVRFVHEGRGTPEPLHPTEKLVITGLYRYVRNPMYLGALIMILGQAVFFENWQVAVFGMIAWGASFVFVLVYEEPTLRKKYGAEYEEYCRRVARWVPKIRRG
jgi:protein-S-isoprenylcysteine O-methyltransferase Ste14